MIKVGIFGCDGYAGEILVDWLSNRDDVTIVYAFTGKEIRVMEKTPGNMHVAYLALPPKISMVIAPQLLRRGIRVIDLSGAYRLKNAGQYRKYYGFDHSCPRKLKKAIYGLPEKNKSDIEKAKLIAVPGCYAKAISLGLLSVLGIHSLAANIKIIINATSGYTGAGKKYIKKYGIPKKITSYKPGREHQHVPEIEQEFQLQKNLLFYPKIAPWPRGIEVEIKIDINPNADLQRLYRLFYRVDPHIQVKNEDVKIDQIVNTNNCCIYPKTNNKSIVINVVIDNLIQGAVGTAIHNMNIMFGLPEKTGLL